MLDFRRGLCRINGHSTNWISLHVLLFPSLFSGFREVWRGYSTQVRINQVQQLVIHRFRFFLLAAAQRFRRAMMQMVAH
jgi:hypothetical protein